MLRKVIVDSSAKSATSGKRLATKVSKAIFYNHQQRHMSQVLQRQMSNLRFVQQSMRQFSTEGTQNQEININSEAEEPILSETEKMEFKAETKKLLDIVAKSIYTDKEVFLRELLSNSSDALEKHRFQIVSGASQQGEDLYINLTTNAKERTISIFDSGIGMTRDEIIDHLGTIARSGSQAFLQSNKDKEHSISDSIIGQFGVGFYSTFVVADSVEVLTKADGQRGVRWVSDGTGEYEVSDAEHLGFDRGTKINLKLKPECREFSQENEIEKVIKKFSQFISYPIKLNGQLLNNLQAIWYRDKREVNTDEYERFFESLANTKVPYKYMLHYSTDVPLAIKAVLYVPSMHNEKMGMSQEQSEVHLYSKKVLIKQRASELLPGYLRFIKGVVDCEDLPLNISRESYQDSSLIAKLRNVLTRRVIKLLEDESKRDAEKYNKWYQDFNMFIKEGLTVDPENSEALFRLARFNTTFSPKSLVSLEDYVAKMKPDQEKIYFIVNPTVENALGSPFMEPFKGSDVPVLLLSNNIDEICFQQAGQYKNKKFINIETSFEDIAKDLGKENTDVSQTSRIPEDDVTTFCLWLKNELGATISKVTLSKRLKDTPAIVVGQMSSSMRLMMQMMDQQGMDRGQQNQQQSLEINPAHPIIVNLNHLRKTNSSMASLLSHQMLDNILLQSGVPFDLTKATKRTYDVIEKMLDSHLENEGAATMETGATRKLKAEGKKEDDKESILSKTHKDIKSQSHHTDKKVVEEYTVK